MYHIIHQNKSVPVQSMSKESLVVKLNFNPGHAQGAARFITTLQPDLRSSSSIPSGKAKKKLLYRACEHLLSELFALTGKSSQTEEYVLQKHPNCQM